MKLRRFGYISHLAMKQLFLILLIVSPYFLYAQENDSIIVVQSRTGRLSGLIDIQDLVNEGYNYWNEEFEGHWSGIELGLNGFSNPDYSMYAGSENNFLENDLWRSNVLNLNILQYSKGLQQTRNTIGLVTGIGLSLQSYRLANSTTIMLDENHRVIPKTLFFDSNQKSKLSTFYIEVPLLLEFQVPIKHHANRMYCSAGVTGARLIEAHTKIKYRKNGKREKLKSPGNYSINDYKVAGTVRVGYRWINLFASYDLVPFFEDRRGPELYPFSVGLKLISF
jgi:hypothetical protein